MKTKFDEALSFTLKWEGGYSYDEDDPGGETYFGISRVNHPNWPGWAILEASISGPPASDDVMDMAVGLFYRDEFWTPLRCDDMPGGVATALFDTAVNCGKPRASRWLQGAVGVVQDGAIGPKTIAAVNASPDEAIRGVINSRSDHYVLIVAKNPALRKFLNGWTNRVMALRQEVGA